VSLAQNPKSARNILINRIFVGKRGQLTDFDVSTRIKKNVVTFDITMNNGLSMQMLEAATSLDKLVYFYLAKATDDLLRDK